MATLTVTLKVSAQTTTEAVTISNARALEFLDDMRNGPYLADPVMTRAEVGEHYIKKLVAGQVVWAKGLKQTRLDSSKTMADDLEGNTS